MALSDTFPHWSGLQSGGYGHDGIWRNCETIQRVLLSSRLTIHQDAPQGTPETLHLYGYKRAADDIATLAKELNAPRIILGGHDWYGPSCEP